MQVVVYGYLPGYEIFIDLQFSIEHYIDMMIKTSAKKSMEAGVISAISVINRNKLLRRNIPGLGVIYRQRYF